MFHALPGGEVESEPLRMSQRFAPPNVVSPASVTVFSALVWDAPLLITAPFPPTPEPEMVTDWGLKLMPFTSSVPVLVMKVTAVEAPRALLLPGRRMPLRMVTEPVKLFVVFKASVLAPFLTIPPEPPIAPAPLIVKLLVSETT